jgi:uncharacterized protein
VIVVSDASPLIGLATVGHLEVLPRLYAEILIPPAVHRELTILVDAPGAAEIGSAAWIRLTAVRDRPLVDSLSLHLDEGEAEAIVLALETRADRLLMDERRGRIFAKRLGQRVLGLLGVLIEAKDSGHLPEVRPVVDALSARLAFELVPICVGGSPKRRASSCITRYHS